MRRPLLCMGALFVLGELVTQLASDHPGGSALLVLIFIICCYISSRFRQNSKNLKRLNLLLFFSFVLGVMWPIGTGWSGDEVGNSLVLESLEDGSRGLDGTGEDDASLEQDGSGKDGSGKDDASLGQDGSGKDDASLGLDGAGEENGSLELDNSEGKSPSMSMNGSGVEHRDGYEIEKSPKWEGLIQRVDEVASGWRLIVRIRREKVLVYVRSEGASASPEPGRYIRVYGHPEELSGATNPGAFDMQDYYGGKGISCQLMSERYEIVEGRINYILLGLHRLRKNLKDSIERYFDEDDAAIICTMLLGDRSDLNSDTKLLFQRSGIAHILAISGLHIALLAGVFEWLLQKLRVRKNIAAILVIIFVFLYGLMTGFSEATLRAVLMLAITRVAFLFGRSADMPTSMMEALIIMNIINPSSLGSSSMLMSFAAVLGVVTGNEFYRDIVGRRPFSFLPKKLVGPARGFTNGFFISASINLWMLPLVMRNYYEVPLFAMLLNMIVIPLLTLVVAGGMLVAAGGLLMKAGGVLVVSSVLPMETGGVLVASSGAYMASSGMSVASGGMSVASGGMSVASGGMSVASGASMASSGILWSAVDGLDRYVGLFGENIKRIAGLCGYVVDKLCRVGAFSCHVVIKLYKLLCRGFLAIPGGVVATGHAETWQLLVMYIVISLVLVLLYLYFRGMLTKVRIARVMETLLGEKLFRGKTGKGGLAGFFTYLVRKWQLKRLKRGKKSNWLSKLKEWRGRKIIIGIFRWRRKDDFGIEELIDEIRESRREEILRKISTSARFFGIFLLLAIIFMTSVRLYNKLGTRIVFLDVGQGDSSIIHLGASDKSYIVDCGSTSRDNIGQYVLIPALKYYAMTELDCIFISHTDEDHVNGIIYLLEHAGQYGIDIENIAFASETDVDKNLSKMLYLAELSETNVVWLKQGDVIDNSFLVMYPEKETSTSEAKYSEKEAGASEAEHSSTEEAFIHSGNDYSLVLQFTLGNIEVLYTGDIGNEAEDRLTGYVQEKRSGIFRILKCAHHGSRYSSSKAFLQKYSPDLTVISVGKNNMYGHPSTTTLQNLQTVNSYIARTDQNGAVIITAEVKKWEQH